MFACFSVVFFFNAPATTEIYTLSLHDALPICALRQGGRGRDERRPQRGPASVGGVARRRDRKSTRLNSSHANISYAVFCLKKKIQKTYCRVPLSHHQEECRRKRRALGDGAVPP